MSGLSFRNYFVQLRFFDFRVVIILYYIINFNASWFTNLEDSGDITTKCHMR